MRQEKRVEIGRRLAELRGGTSQAAFAAALKVAKNTYGTWERGETDIGVECLEALYERGINANWVLTGEGPQLLRDLGEASQPVGFDPDIFIAAFVTVEEAVGQKIKYLSNEKRAEVYAIAYDILASTVEEERPAAKARVFRLVKAMAA